MIENRPLEPLPGLDAGWQVFQGLSSYFTDRLPLRKQAVAIDARIDIDVFGEAPTFGQAANSQVLLGRAGWLYLAEELARACAPPSDPKVTKANVARLTGMVQRSGRRVLFVVVPDKSSVAQEFLPHDDPRVECAAAGRERLWALLEKHPVPGYVDLRTALETEQSLRRSPIYLRRDSHWSSFAASILVREVVERLPGDLWSGSVIKQIGQEEGMGDLTVLAGLPDVDMRPAFGIQRPGDEATVDEQPAGAALHSMRRGGAPVFEGKTLYLYDSFGRIALPGLRQFFGDLTTQQLFDSEPLDIAQGASGWDLIIIEVVEREFTFHFGQWFTGEPFFDLLERSVGGDARRGLSP
jgi:hypothetical protein